MFPPKSKLLKLTAFSRYGLILCFAVLASISVRAQRPYGIDVFAGNGVITWSTVKSANISFAWAKGTEGTYYHDTNFVNNEINGKAAGVYMGAYHFARPDLDSPATEATYFWNFAKNYVLNDGKTLMPMLDFETFNGYVGASSYADWCNQWCYDVQTNAAAAGVNVTPVIYCSACSGACDLDSSDAEWGPWIANYNGQNPQTGTPWSECTSCEAWGAGVWNFWQFTSTTNIPGVPGTYSSGYCDADVFNGTSSQLPLNFVAGSIAVTSAPTNTTVVAGGSVAFKVTASTSGSKLTYQWRFDQVNIPSATTNFYSITNAQISNAGAYSVFITNNDGNILTAPVFLSVIAPLTNSAASILDPSNMVNWWTADGNFFDIYGVTNFTPNGNVSYTNGEIGLAFRLDGSSAYMTSSGGEIAPPWTVCMWLYRQSASHVSAALMGDGTYSLKSEQYSNAVNSHAIGISHSGVADYLFTPPYSAPANVWTHITFVASTTAVTLYTNGVQEGTVSASNFELPRAFIGVDTFSGSPSDFMLGGLDELQIYKRALSASEIKSIFNAGTNGLVRAPQFTGISTNSNGQVLLNLIGQTGKAITINTSTDLLNWAQSGVISNQFGATNYTDPNVSGPLKFYQSTQKY